MIDALDHVAIAVGDLDLAASAYETLIGRPADWREEAAGARHAWFQLSNMALDIVQPDGPGESGERARSRLAAGGDGLWGLAFAVSDLAESRRVLERRGAATAEPMDLLSTDAWRLAFIDEAATHGIPIALAERAAPRPCVGAAFEADQIDALDHLVVKTANADRALALYAARLGLDFRLDRSNREWGSRLLFLRCADLVVEIAADLDSHASDVPDRLTGLAWRVRAPDAARERLSRARFDVSAVRDGRKPGTRVFTVRAGVAGAPALIVSGGGRKP
jgi:catechol 2,3-dioxygenase-like lactoylglutathione lyase family enzyme